MHWRGSPQGFLSALKATGSAMYVLSIKAKSAHPVILSEHSESKDLRTCDTLKQNNRAQILRLHFVPLRMTISDSQRED